MLGIVVILIVVSKCVYFLFFFLLELSDMRADFKM